MSESSSSFSGKTLELAHRLGAVRTKRILSAAINNRSNDKDPAKNAGSKQPFDYLIVIDFESTCWERKSGAPPSEIIEFPAVMIDTAKGDVVDEFHTYVMPTENPKLSEFCTSLTGNL